MNIFEAAKLLGVSRWTLARAIKDERLPVARLGRRVVIKRADIDKLFSQTPEVKMSKVFLREKKLLHGKKGLYLDFYPPIINPETGKPTRREHLKLNVYSRPVNQSEKGHNNDHE